MKLIKHETCREYVARRLSEGWKIVSRQGVHLILSSPDGNILRPIDLRNDVETLRPNADGHHIGINSQFPVSGSHYDKVDEVSADDGGTYVFDDLEAGDYETDWYALPASGIGTGLITKVTVYLRGAGTYWGRIYGPGVYTHGETWVPNGYCGGGTDFDWRNLSNEFANNPFTGVGWTVDEINALEIGWGSYASSGSWTKCTQIYVEIEYTPIPTAPTNCVAHYVATNNAKCTWNDNSNNETGFRIEKAIDGAAFSFWKNVNPGVQDSGTYTLGANHRIAFRVRAYNDAGDSAYSTSGYIYIWTYSENISLSDAYSRVWSIYRTFTESISLSDVYSRVCSWFRTFTENITLADTYSRVWMCYRTFIESIALTDTIKKTVSKTFSENITLTDIYSRVWSIYRTFTETISLADTLKKKITKTFIETLHLQDSYSRVVSWFRTFTEKIILTDTVRKVKSNLLLLWKKLQQLFDIED